MSFVRAPRFGLKYFQQSQMNHYHSIIVQPSLVEELVKQMLHILCTNILHLQR